MLSILGQSERMPASSSRPPRKQAASALPAAYPRLLLDIVAERGIAPDRVLAGTRISEAMLNQPEVMVGEREANRISRKALELTGDPALGLEFGLRTSPTTHGYLGYAAMSSDNLAQAMALIDRFISLRQSQVSMRTQMQGETVQVEIYETHELGPIRQFFFEALTIGLIRIARIMVGNNSLPLSLHFPWPEPEYFAPYRRRLPFVRFDAENVSIRFSARYLQTPLVMADPIARQQAVAQCEREEALHRRAQDNLLDRLRHLIQHSSDGYPSLAEVAAKLLLSERTLKRQLQARGFQFSKLLDEAKYRDARQLLDNPDLDIRDIAAMLGYRDPPSFTRAFRRWSGQTPMAFRQQSRTHQ